VAIATVGGQVHQALDVDGRLATQIAFDHEFAVDGFTDLEDLGVAQLIDATALLDADLIHDLLSPQRADAMDILERDFNALIRRYIDACDTGHVENLLNAF
jgi:hypothetical protein